ncbi:hypothetical protein AX16_003639 [Volvariella volvacea WC 439]|nr:hypothetical protein AX16_003639 [Volvariella volvacea WC 439]
MAVTACMDVLLFGAPCCRAHKRSCNMRRLFIPFFLALALLCVVLMYWERLVFACLSVLTALPPWVQGQGTVNASVHMELGLPTVDTDPYWLELIKHQGRAAFNPNPDTYPVFRNVKDFGARGDGITDDTEAINNAIAFGGRCGGGNCHSSTVTPALVYFPKGTYVVSAPIIAYYYTQLVGDPKQLPTLLAAPTFDGMAVIDADPYIPDGGGAQWYINQNNFFRSVRNFVIDVRQVPPERSQGTGIHWQVSQATSLTNVIFEMSTAPNTAHQGIWMENGSGGMMSDLVFNGGNFGIWAGNQQFTVRNVTINNAKTAILNVWNWGWTYQGLTINNCQVGLDLITGGSVGAVAVIDAVVNDTPVFVRRSQASNGSLSGSIVINNARLNNVDAAVAVQDGPSILEGGTRTIASWVEGNVYIGTQSSGQFVQSDIPVNHKSPAVLDSAGRIFGRTRPQYEDFSILQIISVKDMGAKGDGKTDDTEVINAALKKAAGKKIVFFDAGTYIVTSTISVPPGTRMVGEAWSVISGSGPNFQDPENPQVMIKVGEEGDVGMVEITDMLFSTVGPSGGAIIVEWNIHEPDGQQGGAGMWDSHIRIGGAAGTNLERAQCPPDGNTANCMAAFLALHLTQSSSAYLEGTWVWLADHDLDGDGLSQISIYSGRGILSESAGPVWLIGTGCKPFVGS